MTGSSRTSVLRMKRTRKTFRETLFPWRGRRPLRFWAWILGLVLTLGIGTVPQGSGHAAPGVRIGPSEVHYRFGERITFQVSVTADHPLAQVEVFYRSRALPYTWVAPMQADGQQPGLYRYTHDLAQQPLPPFVEVVYWFRVTPAQGEAVVSREYTFVLADNRFTWSHLEDGPFQVSWYAGDAKLAQQVLDAARQGAQRAREQWQAPPPQGVRFYVYAGVEDLQSALQGLPQWAAGHADPAFGLAFLSLPPTQPEAEIRRQVPHELAHLLLYQATGAGYSRLPAWLNEGLASLAELSPNPDYEVVLRQAVAQRALLPLASLCAGFPPQAAQATLAYSEAAAFTRYLYHTYGAAGLHGLIMAYAQGEGCTVAPQRVLGVPWERLESEWLASLGASPPPATPAAGAGRWAVLTPWLVLLLVILLPLGVNAWFAARHPIAEERQG